MTTTDTKATARPWRMSGPDTIIDGYDTICTLWPNGKVSQRKRGQQIVRAVNQLEALNAVAEAARNFINILGHVSDDVQDDKNALKQALSALEAIRKEGSV